MVDIVTVGAFALLVVGVIGSVVPGLPGPLASLAGLGVYWWGSNYAEPSTLVVVAIAAVGIVALAVDLAGGAAAARAAGASTTTMILAGIVGLLLGLVTGPVGLVIGIAGTVFLVEFVRDGDGSGSVRTALYATVGVLASGVVQGLLTGSMLVAVAIVAFV
ncbi:DUF456 domain-containing protein [Halobacteriales archaeon SW_7_68_16]|nr:MAG: DUF456 domain-containing protein [Halobacteriales archaeon SW_7_68_16]